MDIRMPGVQYPHCSPCASQNDCCIGCRSPSVPPKREEDKPSTVVMERPSACTANIRQDLADSPSNKIVQAPHAPCSQPTCVPVRPNSWRMKSLNSMRGSTVREYSFPFTVMVTTRFWIIVLLLHVRQLVSKSVWLARAPDVFENLERCAHCRTDRSPFHSHAPQQSQWLDHQGSGHAVTLQLAWHSLVHLLHSNRPILPAGICPSCPILLRR